MLPRERWAEAAAIQDERRQHDPWDDALADINGALYGDEEWIKAQELLGILGVTSDRATSEIYKRLKRVMGRLGWRDGRHYFGGKHQRGYVRRETEEDGETGSFES